MNELIVAPDIEQWLVDYLSAELPKYGFTAQVSTSLPNPRPDYAVVLQRTGGIFVEMVLDSASVSIDTRAPTENEAYQLAAHVRALIHAAEGQMAHGLMVYDVIEAAGPQNYPDSETPDQARYRQLLQITVHGAILVKV